MQYEVKMLKKKVNIKLAEIDLDAASVSALSKGFNFQKYPYRTDHLWHG